MCLALSTPTVTALVMAMRPAVAKKCLIVLNVFSGELVRNIKDLHFHDLRHEAISQFFEKGLSIPEVALISGHKDVRMLFRYTHLKAEDILRKL